MKDSIGSYLISKLRGREHLNISKPHLGKTTHLGKEGSQAKPHMPVYWWRVGKGAPWSIPNSIQSDYKFGCKHLLKMPKLQVWSWSTFWGCPMSCIEFGIWWWLKDAYKYIHVSMYVTIWWPNMKKWDISIRQRRQLFQAANFCKNGRLRSEAYKGLEKNPIFNGKKTNQPIGGSVAGSQVTMPRSKSLGRLARILPRIGARWFHVTWNDWNWEKMVWNHMEFCDDNWGERYSRWPGVCSFFWS